MNKVTSLPSIYTSLASIFNNHGYRLYIVGGTTRDILLNKQLTDYDFVTDATIDDMKDFLDVSNYSNSGSISIKYEGIKIDLTTLRIESGYEDFRHPSKVTFIKNPKDDSLRRDFTLNALYIDEEGNILDFHHGLEDLKNKKLVFIGEANKRIKEDPLRILRGIRFSLLYEFEITFDEEIKENFNLLKMIPIKKAFIELNKIKQVSSSLYNETFNKYHLDLIYPHLDIKENKNILIDNDFDILSVINKETSLYLVSYSYYLNNKEEFNKYDYLFNICYTYEDYFKTKEAGKLSLYLYTDEENINEDNQYDFIFVKGHNLYKNKIYLNDEDIKNNNLNKVLSLMKKSDKINRNKKELR
jgi:tRNA nucleotidyltransferase/poly(A) polymerase